MTDHLQDDAVPMPSRVAEGGYLAPPRQRGYPLQIIADDKADEKFCCSDCHLILRNPMQSSCGHRFCHDCLKAMQMLEQRIQCKACVDEGVTGDDSYLDFNEMFEDKAAKREMRKLPVKCLSTGCTWKGLFHEILEHENKCDKKLVPCSQCGQNVTKSRLTNHETKTCPKRSIHCVNCREEIIFENKEKHNEECPQYTIKCDKCHTSIERYKLKDHQDTECVNRMIKCPLPECKTELPMDKFLTHICKDENLARHIVYLLDKCGMSEDRLQRLETRNSDEYPEEASAPSNRDPQPSTSHVPHESQDQLDVSERTQGDGAQAEGLYNEDRQKLKLHEDLMSVLHSEILRCITKGEALGRGMENSEKRMRDCYAKIEHIDRRLNTFMETNREVSSRSLGETDYGELINEGNGFFTWIIKDYSQLISEANMICSPLFFTNPSGYKMRLKWYANGEGNQNINKNVSLYLQTLKGPCDSLLLWPFSPKVSFMLLDQVGFQHHHVKVFSVDSESPASRRPTVDVGVASGCPDFISIKSMNDKRKLYWPSDVVYLKFHIEVPKQNLDRINSLNPLRQASLPVFGAGFD